MSAVWDKWTKGAIAGKLLGTSPYLNLRGQMTVFEVYFLDDKNVGLKYPDNSRIVAPASWLTYGSIELQEAFKNERQEYYSIHGHPPLNLKHRGQQRLKLGTRLSKKSQELKARLEAEQKVKPKLNIKKR